MRKKGLVIILFLALVILAFSSASGQSANSGLRDPQFEQSIYDRLARINPEAVPIFKKATEAMDAGSMDEAKAGYEQVLALAPDFPDALRRLSYVEADLGDLTMAEQYGRQALKADSSPENQAGLARILAQSEDSSKKSEALTLAKAASQAQPNDPYTAYMLCMAAAVNGDITTLRQASRHLIELSPQEPLGYYFAGLVAADDGQWELAESELLLAQKYGVPQADIEAALNETGIRAQARLYRGLRWGGYGLVGWLVGLVLLFMVGVVLSWLTLRAVHREMSSGQFEISPAERLVRRLYGVLIGIASAYFYLSIPVLILIVVGAVGGILYLFISIGRIPIQLIAFILIFGVYTLISIFRSLLIRIRREDPGRKVADGEMPELRQLVSEVAQRLGTCPVDAIFLTPGVEAAVTERGSLVSKLRDRGERILILGLGALSGLTQGQLRSILAHEYGHFNNRDTAGGGLAWQVRLSVYTLAYNLASRGLARWYNPVWWFVNGYYRIFLRIIFGATRLQEILADRFAVLAYGVRNLTSGLQQIVRQNLAFDTQVNAEVKQAQSEHRGLHNLYALPPVQDVASFEKSLAEVMAKPGSAYDSHPSLKERIALAERIKVSGYFEEDWRPAWDLIPGAAQLQMEITTIVDGNLRQQKILTPEAGDPA